SVFHCDFYRIGPGEEEETGFAEMCRRGVVLVEWPAAVERSFPPDRLEIRIEGEGSTRHVSMAGFGAWRSKLTRLREVSAFLSVNAWAEARCRAVRGDASVRTFARLERGSETVMVIDWPRQSDGPPIRSGRPYSDIAHLATEGRPFLAIAGWLREKAGLSAPTVIGSDLDGGLYLVEDLGDAVFSRLVTEGAALEPLYSLAVDGLLAIRATHPPGTLPLKGGASHPLPAYDREALEIELDLLLQWYFALRQGQQARPNVAASFWDNWAPFLDWLEGQPRTLVLRDYHSPNLLLCEGRSGLKRLGVVDFQDAVWGHPAYDLVSLLQDARVDIDEGVERSLFAAYCEKIPAIDPNFDAAAFAKAYALLGVQRNTKILGIFARLSLRDGKHAYLAHLPRVAGYLFRNLAHPELKPLKAWYEAHLPGHEGTG
ncbi:MAG TPA: tRNA (adenosine(37)-N6)-threonylcarbamoyltransferase complex ATPase subunit type 1 TsaE, partial [Hyphomicrobiales bacterium]|nr:tRNA (adenosine(37)-N6)-threonylcarbamoyltransferase complex ATPase subunit type 1 TsaE [Hyphomicrobiales bacterium]